jgi:aminopeptidase-like protein
MILEPLQSPGTARSIAAEAQALVRQMYPLCRSLTGNGVRATLDLIEDWVPLQRLEIPTGTALFDWEVPREWNIRDAYIADASGRRVVDFHSHNLHVVNYSCPVRTTLTLDELQPHLHSLPDQPDRIPYRTTYWREQWGFCLRHRDRERLAPGSYEVVVDSTLAPGSMTLAEVAIPGSGAEEAIVYTHTCHPSLANDNLTGIVVAAALARAMQGETPRLTWRFVFGPGTLGSLAWLAGNERRLPRLRCGLTLGLLGDPAPLTYKRSRRGDTVTDRTSAYVLGLHERPTRVVDFEPYGYDERQFCSPGFDLPIGRLSRAQHGEYAEYHTSADDLSIVEQERLAESIAVAARLVATLDANRALFNLAPKGEPRLGKRGLYGAVGGRTPAQFEQALLWLLNLSDGRHDLVAIAARSKLPFALIDGAATALCEAGLLSPTAGTDRAALAGAST